MPDQMVVAERVRREAEAIAYLEEHHIPAWLLDPPPVAATLVDMFSDDPERPTPIMLTGCIAGAIVMLQREVRDLKRKVLELEARQPV